MVDALGYAGEMALCEPIYAELWTTVMSYEAAFMEAGIVISYQKTNWIVFATPGTAGQISKKTIKPNGGDILQVESFKYLVVWFEDTGNEKLTFKQIIKINWQTMNILWISYTTKKYIILGGESTQKS